MAYYDRRDLIGHWIRKDQRTGHVCTHACCRGYRVHPQRWPVIPADPVLRRATDEDLAAHYDRVSADPSPQARYAENQIMHELGRRDEVNELRRRRADAKSANRAAARMEREAEAERIRRDVEAQTRGYLVTAQGRARGISDAEVLTGPERVFIRYATPEAKAYFTARPRPTAAYLRTGRDTSVPYSDRPAPRRRRPGRALAGLRRPA